MPRIETRLAGLGCTPDPVTGGITPPVHFATTFERAVDGSYPKGYFYARHENPTRHLLETAIADLEGGVGAAAFASGMAAASTILQALGPGDHVVLPTDIYHGVRTVVRNVFERWGLEWTEVDPRDVSAVREALRPETKLVWAESPSNPLLNVLDLSELAHVAHSAGALLVVDNTWSPLIQRPIEHGADLVMHSMTKYLSGHSDVLGGVVVGKEDGEFFVRIRDLQKEAGAVSDPMSCWLTVRGMRSLAVRMKGHSQNAGVVARFLEGHARVSAVYYPGLASHPGHDVARRQMSDFGGMLSFEVDGAEEDALSVVGKARVFRRATSLGGTESLIEHRASVEGPYSPTPRNLIRLSVGLEHPDDLIADLEEALEEG